jgi:hypothetical protein
VAGHIAVIHLKVERFIFLVLPNGDTFDLATAMRALSQLDCHLTVSLPAFVGLEFVEVV